MIFNWSETNVLTNQIKLKDMKTISNLIKLKQMESNSEKIEDMLRCKGYYENIKVTEYDAYYVVDTKVNLKYILKYYPMAYTEILFITSVSEDKIHIQFAINSSDLDMFLNL